MKNHRFFLAVTLVACSLGALKVQAQPDANNAPKGANPPVQMPFPGAGDWQKMTPQQRREAVQKGVEGTLRGSMTWLGYTDAKLQDAVIAAAMEREKSLDKVRDANFKLTQGVLAKANDKDIAVLMNDLDTAIEDAKAERETLMQTLDAKIDFSGKPRLQAFLTLVGINGDQSAQMGGIIGNTTGVFTNLAMKTAEQEEKRKANAQDENAPAQADK